MYKRAVRIVFLGAPPETSMARACALGIGGKRIEVRARCTPGSDLPAGLGDGLVLPLDDADLAWADLCVVLDAAVGPLDVRRGLAVRYWTDGPAQGSPDAYVAFLAPRIEGIIGGLRLLERMDQQ
ncbi:MAG: hypothetical protein ACYDDA_08220 [Acidiferrobacteraceae bacterium]